MSQNEPPQRHLIADIPTRLRHSWAAQRCIVPIVEGEVPSGGDPIGGVKLVPNGTFSGVVGTGTETGSVLTGVDIHGSKMASSALNCQLLCEIEGRSVGRTDFPSCSWRKVTHRQRDRWIL